MLQTPSQQNERPTYNRNIYITESDRRRLGSLLSRREHRAWGNSRWLSELEARLEQAKSVDPDAASEYLVTMNSTVLLSGLRTGKRYTFTLVYPEDAETHRDGLSVFDPLGAALLGSIVGEMVECPTGQHEPMRVLRILYQPEQAGELHL